MTAVILDPERQYLGCVLQLDTNPARRLLAGMQAAELADPTASTVLHLAIELIAADQAPSPLALLDRAWESTDRRPWTGGPHRLQALDSWLRGAAPPPPPGPRDHRPR